MGKQCSSKLCQSSNHLKGAKSPAAREPGQGPLGRRLPNAGPSGSPVNQLLLGWEQAANSLFCSFRATTSLPDSDSGVSTPQSLLQLLEILKQNKAQPRGWLEGPVLEPEAPLWLGFYLPTLQDISAGERKTLQRKVRC